MRYIEVYKCEAYNDLFPAVYSLLKNGTFSSAKQYRFLRDRRGVDENINMWVQNPPADAELVIKFQETFAFAQNGKRFGRKQRRRERIIYCNSGGILRIDTLKIKYSDKEGRSWVDCVEQGEYTARQPNPEVVALDQEAQERQTAFVAKKEERLEAVSKITLEQGRQTIRGKIISFKRTETEDHYGRERAVLKMLVEREDGVRFFGSCPSGLMGVSTGTMVEFSAEITPKEAGFAFYSRPTKARELV